jgi:chromosome segregation ATPase
MLSSNDEATALVMSQMAEREFLLREEAQSKDAALRQAEARIAAVEARIRERDTQVLSLKEEKTASVRQITDLKNQLYQLQFEVEETTCDKIGQDDKHRTELGEARREINEAKRALDTANATRVNVATKADELERENDELRSQLMKYQNNSSSGGRDDEQILDVKDIELLQKKLSELESNNTTLTAQIAEERSNLVTSSKLNAKEVANLRNMLRARDDTIRGLQARVERGEKDMTELEREMDVLRAGENGKYGPLPDDGGMEVTNENRIVILTKETEELKRLVETQNDTLKEITIKYDKQKAELDEQRQLVVAREEEIKELKGSNSREEIYYAEVAFKGGRISSLEKEILEASSLLVTRADDDPPLAPPSPGVDEDSGRGEESGGSFGHLREEIKRVTLERARLESDHARQLNSFSMAKDRLTRELTEVRARLSSEIENSTFLKAELDKTRQVMDQLDAEEDLEFEETRGKVKDLELANAELQREIETLRTSFTEKERMWLEEEKLLQDELHDAQQQLTLASTNEGDRDCYENNNEKMDDITKKLSASEERVRYAEAKFRQTVREKDTFISDLKIELSSKEQYAEDLRHDLEQLQLSVESTDRGPTKRNYGMAIDPEWHEPDIISKLKVEVSTLKKDKKRIEQELRAKIESRDSTIATLVLSSSNQERSISELKSELNQLQNLLDKRSSSGTNASQQLKELEASRRREVELLKERTHDLTIELKQTKRKLFSVTGQLDSAMSQLKVANTMPDVQDLAGRLVVAEQAQKMLKTENLDKLKERDAAIANLLQSVQSSEGTISNLRDDVEMFKHKLNDAVQENQRLQHESEIFATQIIEQDREFENLNARLKEKTNEINSLKREIASSSADVRNMKQLQSQLDELREEKWTYANRINKLEVELRDVELRKAERDGYEVERLKLELKSATADKDAIAEKMNRQIESLRHLHSHAAEELRNRDEKIASLEKELIELRELMAEETMDDVFLNDRDGQAVGQSNNKELIEERDMLLAKVGTLSREIESLKNASESTIVAELKTKLARSEQVREELEKDRAHFMSNKDKEMDRFRLQLAETRQQSETRDLEQLNLLKKFEAENEQLQEEFAMRMREKNSKIIALEQTLSAQEQVVGTMSNEMDQLQNGMEKVAIQRRAEIEELNQELMDYTSKATRLEREVLALTMKLDDKKLRHKAEVQKLKDRIAAIESGDIVHHDNRDDKQLENELKEKNDHLKWLNSTLKDENKRMKEKIDKLKTDSTKLEDSPLSKTAKNNDKWRNVALQEQVAVLSQRVIELEEAASGTTQQRRSPVTPSHSPVIRSARDNSPAGTPQHSSIPKSALRFSSYTTDRTKDNANDLLSDAAIFNSTAGSSPARTDVSSNSRGSESGIRGPPIVMRPPSSRFSIRRKSNKDTATDSVASSTNYNF